jgi:hypothetical protein
MVLRGKTVTLFFFWYFPEGEVPGALTDSAISSLGEKHQDFIPVQS